MHLRKYFDDARSERRHDNTCHLAARWEYCCALGRSIAYGWDAFNTQRQRGCTPCCAGINQRLASTRAYLDLRVKPLEDSKLLKWNNPTPTPQSRSPTLWLREVRSHLASTPPLQSRTLWLREVRPHFGQLTSVSWHAPSSYVGLTHFTR